MTEPMPIQNLDAERSLLGAALQSQQAYAEAGMVIRGEDFYKPAHRAVWDAIAAVDEVDDYVARVLAVSDELHRRGQRERIGGAPYLQELVAQAPVSAGVAAGLAESVREASMGRRSVATAQRIIQIAHAGAGAQELASAFESIKDIADEATSGAAGDVDVADPNELADNVLELLRSPAPETLPMGYPDLDKVTGGLGAGQMVCIAARPGVGKTVLALGTALNVAKAGGSVAFFSFEMLRDEIAMRCFANLGRVDQGAMNSRSLSEFEWQRVTRAADTFRELPLHISDRAEVTAAGIRATCRDLARSGAGLDLVVVDYLQLTTTTNPRVSREQQVSELSRALKLLAMELRVPVIAVSQLNRGPEQRQDKRPQMSDLRESGAIEQDCDKILLLHHDASDEIRAAAELEVIVAKNRQGDSGVSVTLGWSPRFASADSMSRQVEPMRGVA